MGKPRKPIADIIGELQSWLPNYDHGEKEYPTVLFRLLASAPGGDELVDMGYEPFNLGWQEVDQLGRVLVAIQDKRDVEDIVRALTSEEEQDVDESRRRRRPPAARESAKRDDDRPIGMTYGTLPAFKKFEKDIRRPDPEHPGQAYWPDGSTFPMELTQSDEIELATDYGGLTPFRGKYAHKAGFKGDEQAIYGFLEYLINAWNEGNEPAGDLASSIMTVLGYEWI